MKKILLLLILTSLAFGQLDTKEKELKKRVAKEKVAGFHYGAIVNLSMNQVSFNNWSAGGNNSLSANSLINYFFYYKKDKMIWDNYGSIGYGILNQESNDDIIKTDDKIEFTSKLGYNSVNNFYYATLFNLKTQMAPGYANPEDSVKISDFLSPLYLTGSIGMDYQQGDRLSLFAAPISGKMTYVGNQDIADAGGYGVDKAEYDNDGNKIKDGNNIKGEFGGYVKVYYKDDIMENVQLVSKIDLFSNYLDSPQNIDINWEILLNMKINKYLSANLSTYMIYDDDIKIADEDNPEKPASPKLQFKEILGIGISFTL